jgi:hypothetical protein
MVHRNDGRRHSLPGHNGGRGLNRGTTQLSSGGRAERFEHKWNHLCGGRLLQRLVREATAVYSGVALRLTTRRGCDSAYSVTWSRNLPIPPSLFTFVGTFSSCATCVPE